MLSPITSSSSSLPRQGQGPDKALHGIAYQGAGGTVGPNGEAMARCCCQTMGRQWGAAGGATGRDAMTPAACLVVGAQWDACGNAV